MKNTEVTEKTRKRARNSEDAEDGTATSGGKKARGRPRVDTQDATAADRRRTQIRLAQRAYRQRKETTITSLKQQRSQLHSIIDEMNKTFLRYNESIAQSGVMFNPDLAVEIRKMNESFANCVKTANDHTQESDEEEAVAAGPVQESRPDVAPAMATEASPPRNTAPVEEATPWSYGVVSHASDRSRLEDTAPQPGNYLSHISSSSYDFPQTSHASLVRRYRYTVGEVLDQSQSKKASHQPRTNQEVAHEEQQQSQQSQQQHPHQPQNQFSLPFGLLDIPSREQSPYIPPIAFPVEISAPAMGAELPPPPPKAHRLHPISLTETTLPPANTYSFQEVNFARRLMRGTYELAVLMLSSPHIHPAILQHIFKLSLPYLTLDNIRSRFKTILSRGVTEDLDWYATPFLHLGGAGTHYQRRDPDGKPVPMKNSWTVRQIGPLDRRMIRMENVTDGQIHDLQGIDLTGFEGEFFDAYDIQGYLEDRWHCRIDARSSFAECLIDDEDASFADKEGTSPSLSRGSTTSPSDATTPPALPILNATQPSYGLPISLNSASLPDPFSAPLKQNLSEISFDQTLGLDLAPSFDTGFAGNNAYSSFGFDVMGVTEQLPTARHTAKKSAWLDVQKFMDSVMRGAVCLGRAPGYRRKDVDAAFQDALILV